ncbi:hypothetical protein EF888_01430 [Silicimonas algicola]|uniref:Uncharacterized protein n=1 Tax=Silicimonas algicola TaxID=1826607 RepID=A0A316FS88_9RHOB|nr:hypothetical protein [Silicimonas algicola]AZQ65910.1 hypothetical protein EF888_01430 [Silicimonas algicola]PWK50975.1 hypothetical protein C8D95_1197 [Silicimonas algicola]
MPVANDAYVRPFSPDAPWNIPVAGLPRAENSEELASKLWDDSYTDREVRNFNINNTSYTYPVYEVTEDTPDFPVVDRNGWGNLGGTRIPFDPSWEAAPGSDAQIIILDPATGREWNLWQAEFDGNSVNVSNGNLVPGSYFDNEEGFAPSRGVGIQYSAMLVRPEEVAQGVIEHALSMPIQNTSGSEFVAPGTKLEFPGVRLDGIPEGTRFALDVSYDDIDAHIARLPDSVSDVTANSLRTIMVAMKDYGWFITDTAGSAHFQLESTTSAREEWEELGMIDKDYGGAVYPRDALDGLMTESRIVAFVPSDQYPTPADDDEAIPEDDLIPLPPGEDEDDAPDSAQPADPVDTPAPTDEDEGTPSEPFEPPPEDEVLPVDPGDDSQPAAEDDEPDEKESPSSGPVDLPPEEDSPPAGEEGVPDTVSPGGSDEQSDEEGSSDDAHSRDDVQGLLGWIIAAIRRIFGREVVDDDPQPVEPVLKSEVNSTSADHDDDSPDLRDILPVVGRMEDQSMGAYEEDEEDWHDGMLV